METDRVVAFCATRIAAVVGVLVCCLLSGLSQAQVAPPSEAFPPKDCEMGGVMTWDGLQSSCMQTKLDCFGGMYYSKVNSGSGTATSSQTHGNPLIRPGGAGDTTPQYNDTQNGFASNQNGCPPLFRPVMIGNAMCGDSSISGAAIPEPNKNEMPNGNCQVNICVRNSCVGDGRNVGGVTPRSYTWTIETEWGALAPQHSAWYDYDDLHNDRQCMGLYNEVVTPCIMCERRREWVCNPADTPTEYRTALCRDTTYGLDDVLFSDIAADVQCANSVTAREDGSTTGVRSRSCTGAVGCRCDAGPKYSNENWPPNEQCPPFQGQRVEVCADEPGCFCAPQVVSWGGGCSGTSPYMQHGDSENVSMNTPLRWGSVDVTCNLGALQLSNPTCETLQVTLPPPPPVTVPTIPVPTIPDPTLPTPTIPDLGGLPDPSLPDIGDIGDVPDIETPGIPSIEDPGTDIVWEAPSIILGDWSPDPSLDPGSLGVPGADLGTAGDLAEAFAEAGPEIAGNLAEAGPEIAGNLAESAADYVDDAGGLAGALGESGQNVAGNLASEEFRDAVVGLADQETVDAVSDVAGEDWVGAGGDMADSFSSIPGTAAGNLGDSAGDYAETAGELAGAGGDIAGALSDADYVGAAGGLADSMVGIADGVDAPTVGGGGVEEPPGFDPGTIPQADELIGVDPGCLGINGTGNC